MPEDIALFIDFENIRYSMLNIQRREPDPQELIAVAFQKHEIVRRGPGRAADRRDALDPVGNSAAQ